MPRAIHQLLLTGCGVALALGLSGTVLASAPAAPLATIAPVQVAMHVAEPRDVAAIMHSLAPHSGASRHAGIPGPAVNANDEPRTGTLGMVLAALALMGVIAFRRQRLERP